MRIPDKIITLPVILVVFIILGAVFAYHPSPYTHGLDYDVHDGVVDYQFSSNIGMETHMVIFSNSGLFDIETVVFYVDHGYASRNPWGLQEEMYEDMEMHLSVRSFDGFIYCTAQEMSDLMSIADPSKTALMFASGSFPDLIYDGKAECPLVDWLDRGGVVVNISGCFGKYVSHGPDPSDIEEIEDFGDLFAEADDDAFMDGDTRRYADYECNEDIRDSLNFMMNEITYGVDLAWLDDRLPLGYVDEEGISAATLFKSGNGMVMNFGASLSSHVHFDYHIAQIIVAGLDYTSKLIESIDGHTRADPSGSFSIPDCSYTAYGFIGDIRPVFGLRMS